MQQSDIAHHNGDVRAAILRGRSVALNDVRSQAGAGNPKTSPTSQRCDHDIRWKSVPHRLPARMKRAPGSGAPSNFLTLNASLWRTLQPLSDGRQDLVAARSHRRTKKPRARRGKSMDMKCTADVASGLPAPGGGVYSASDAASQQALHPDSSRHRPVACDTGCTSVGAAGGIETASLVET
jgi:hypothetical protein